MAAPRLVLASRGIPGLAELLPGPGTRAVLVPTASNGLDEPGIPEEVERELEAAQLRVERHDLDAASPQDTRAALRDAGVVAVSGGDPFRLLAAARASGFREAMQEALARGTIYVGYSAGAMVAGPTLEPLRRTSPFAPPAGMDLTGLALTDVLVLPHHGAPGRAERHADALEAFGESLRLHPLRDGDVVVVDAGRVSLRRA